MIAKRTFFTALFMLAGLFLAGLLAAPASAARCYDQQGLTVCDSRPAPQRFVEPPYHPDSIYYYRSYAWIDDYAPFYSAPNGQQVDQASEGILYYTIEEQRTDAAGLTWYRVDDRWASAENMHPYTDSRFPGVAIQMPLERPFGWVLWKFQPAPAPGIAPAEDAPWFQRYDFIQIYDAFRDKEERVWYDLGGDQWVREERLAVVDANPRPEDVGPDQFWVEVDLYEQTAAAYEGDRMVYATLVSTGNPGFETNEGLFTVYARHLEWDMWGGDVGDDYYYLQDVPHTMFFDKDIALHGAYWHDNFGEVRSHGCVNMPPRSAEWVYYWSEEAPDDTLWVWVHTSSPEQTVNVFNPDAPATSTN